MDENILNKVCFKCGRNLPLSNYYKHPKTADGHLNKCKECARNDAHNKYEENKQDASYVEKERKRGRTKYARLYGNFDPEIFKPRDNSKKLFDSYASAAARNIRRKVMNHGIIVRAEEHLHHWSYSAPSEVFVVTKEVHHAIHHLTRYSVEHSCFRDLRNGEYLDTVEKYKRWLRNNGLPYRLFISM